MFTMKEIVKVQSIEEAFELNKKRANKILGGMLWMKMQKKNIGIGIDLSGLGLDSIEETEEEFKIGCMCSLRTLETHVAINTYFQDAMKECVRHIVGVQFRNSATVGGSIYGRYGFSDLLTCFLALDSYVELHEKGIVPLKEFVQMPYDNDVLVSIIIKKDQRDIYYETLRASATDFPIIACAVARKDQTWFVSVGAKPTKATLETIKVDTLTKENVTEIAEQLASKFVYGTNMRGSELYRKKMAGVLIRRGMCNIVGGTKDAN